MKITLLSDDAIRLEPDPGPLTVEAPTAEMSYSPFHMLASGLATCTFSVMYSWATQAKLSTDDLSLEVQWRFADDPHRVSDIGVIFDWPSLPATRLAAAKRVAEMCAVHATLTHPPRIAILAAAELPAHEHEHEDAEHVHERVRAHRRDKADAMMVPVVRFTVAGQEAPSHGLGRAYTVVFDGDCRVCTRLARMLAAWDGGRQLEIVTSQQPGVMARFPWIPPRAYADALQLVAADGTTWQGSAAIEQLLTVLPRGRWIAWVFKVPFVRTLADRFYRWFARNRYRLGCGAHCQSRPLDVIWEEAEKAS